MIWPLRKPDVIVGVDYLDRWHLIPRNRYFNVYLHRFIGSDPSVFHDHPWWSCSFLLRGLMWEEFHSGRGFGQMRVPLLLPVVRPPELAHRLRVVRGPVWTLFITGPRLRVWGFWCPNGWRRFDEVRQDADRTVICD